jgi:uncharacterized small protein (DUF1192 family)
MEIKRLLEKIESLEEKLNEALLGDDELETRVDMLEDELDAIKVVLAKIAKALSND